MMKNGHSTIKVEARAVVTPPVKPYVRIATQRKLAPRVGSEGPWEVPDLCTAYHWPKGLNGGGVIGIVELGGGWVTSDMEKFFDGIHQPMPDITDVSVDGTTNSPGSGQENADGEVALDIQIAAAAYYCATGRPATIRVYWTSDIASGVRRATEDGCDVFTCSWGADEALWGHANAEDMEQAAADATAAGMIVFAASGDNDSADGGPSAANVDLPASAPHVIGCGGTMKRGSTETVWNEDPGSPTGEGTGGGFSTLFPMPPWQNGAPHGPGRMVPDVAGDADPDTGYRVVVNGEWLVIGGTSAVAPLYAGLFASFGRKLGFVTPLLWSHHTCFHDIVEGDNGAYRAAIGPDPCTGLGSPIGKRLATLLANHVNSTLRRTKDLERELFRLRALVVEFASSSL